MTPAPSRKLPIDPAWVALAVAAIVLIGTAAWLASSRPVSQAHVEAEPAVAAPPAPTPMETQLAELTARLAATEASLAELRARPAGDPAALAALGQRLDQDRTATTQAMDSRVKALEEGLAQRLGESNAALGRRLDALEQAAAQRTEAEQGMVRRLGSLEQAAAQRAEAEQGMVRRLGALEQAATQRAEAEQGTVRRLEALDRSMAERTAGELAVTRRIEAVDQAAAQRAANAEQATAQRLAAIEQGLAQRLTALDQSTTERLAPLQDALRRLSAAEARTRRLGAIDALRTLLDAGQPLGSALPGLGAAPPEPLARYTSAAPPTEAALRLSFEEAVRQARATNPAQESLTNRLNSLLTIRRGDEVIWGDSSEVQIERARRALEAGDVEGALAALARLPEANRAALRGWIGDAEALVAARAALRSLAAG